MATSSVEAATASAESPPRGLTRRNLGSGLAGGRLWRSRRGRTPQHPRGGPGERGGPASGGTKEEPGFWTRRRAFVQVKRGSNIQLLSFSLVSQRSRVQIPPPPPSLTSTFGASPPSLLRSSP